jgi:hypothetical protein
MGQSLLDDPKHWRDRAVEARAMAEDMKDPQSKQTMLNIAADCDGLAKRAEQREACLPPENSN